MYKKIYDYIFRLYKKKLTASQLEQTTAQTETKHRVINFHKKTCSKEQQNMNVKVNSFANSPPNQMSHCPQWGSDWKVREGSVTSSMVR